MRIGSGFDVHAFGIGNHVTLAGVRIEHTHGLVAHSDGDVAIHALCDALLGALALGDIGVHFPPGDARYRGADSRELLRHCVDLIGQHGWKLGNADLTIICERPKIITHTLAMRELLAQDCAVDLDCVSVKATTTERLGFTGRAEGIAAHAVVLLASR